MNKIVLLILFIGFHVACSQITSPDQVKMPEYYQIISDELSGNLAFETVAFVEQYWRIVGNKGFDSSIYKVVSGLEKAGYIREDRADTDAGLTYRIEERPMERPTWEPVRAQLTLSGTDNPLLTSVTNRNMIAINSYSTPAEGVTGEVIYIENLDDLDLINVTGKIVYAKLDPYALFEAAVQQHGALGVLAYDNPSYLKPEKNKTSIQFRDIPLDENVKSWAIALSYEAMQILDERVKQEGAVRASVQIKTELYPSKELTVVANVRGMKKPEERLVFSAHVQEPGANDNASGVGLALEMATITAKLIDENKFQPERTLTFLWGDEIVSTGRYVKEDAERADGIKWGISLDMVGQNTAITGGTFLIEKMPDPSAIWTRGNDQHTEWGASEMTLADMKPHYLNDFLINRFMEQSERTGWQVKTNPFEGGSDHVPFLKANIPSVLFWHFTDQFYHTDNDRLDKVSRETLKNVGVTALVSAYTLLNADANTVLSVIEEVKKAGIARIREELIQGRRAVQQGETRDTQIRIIEAWQDWYEKALQSCEDFGVADPGINKAITTAQEEIKNVALESLKELEE